MRPASRYRDGHGVSALGKSLAEYPVVPAHHFVRFGCSDQRAFFSFRRPPCGTFILNINDINHKYCVKEEMGRCEGEKGALWPRPLITQNRPQCGWQAGGLCASAGSA
jgi:hypothetical protein